MSATTSGSRTSLARWPRSQGGTRRLSGRHPATPHREHDPGTFRHQVRYPPGAQLVQEFTTERPAFANDNLFQRLQATGVTVTANPQRTPLWEQLLLWFGPALLLGGLLALYWRRAAGPRDVDVRDNLQVTG